MRNPLTGDAETACCFGKDKKLECNNEPHHEKSLIAAGVLAAMGALAGNALAANVPAWVELAAKQELVR